MFTSRQYHISTHESSGNISTSEITKISTTNLNAVSTIHAAYENLTWVSKQLITGELYVALTSSWSHNKEFAISVENLHTIYKELSSDTAFYHACFASTGIFESDLMVAYKLFKQYGQLDLDYKSRNFSNFKILALSDDPISLSLSVKEVFDSAADKELLVHKSLYCDMITEIMKHYCPNTPKTASMFLHTLIQNNLLTTALLHKLYLHKEILFGSQSMWMFWENIVPHSLFVDGLLDDIIKMCLSSFVKMTKKEEVRVQIKIQQYISGIITNNTRIEESTPVTAIRKGGLFTKIDISSRNATESQPPTIPIRGICDMDL